MAEDKFHCYATKAGDHAQEYFLYWLAESSVLGLTDLAGNVYEAPLDRRARKKMLRNVAESLVENKWRSVFGEKALKVRAVHDDAAEIAYIAEHVKLQRIATGDGTAALVESPSTCRARDVFLLKCALNEIHTLRERLRQKSPRTAKGSQPNPTRTTIDYGGGGANNVPLKSQRTDYCSCAASSNNGDAVGSGRATLAAPTAVASRRKRGKATGVVFSDDDDNAE